MSATGTASLPDRTIGIDLSRLVSNSDDRSSLSLFNDSLPILCKSNAAQSKIKWL
ncbi:hypothetical protein X736_26740 [Mesorhizobium sp. L2C089B000]|nr:hypothetical protein X736_26740 [Mesorhizobium sp. L2C089B000]ESZ55104.1 hypothetical protein X728_30510 [Mesorhizobium sp. L103C120A0]